MNQKQLFSFFSLLFLSIGANCQDSFSLDTVLPIQNNQTLFLKTSEASVSIEGEERNDVEIEIRRVATMKKKGTKDPFKVTFSSNEQGLKIIQGKKADMDKMVSIKDLEYSISIKIPDWVNLDLRGEEDSYDINYLKGNLKVSNETGDISATALQGKVNIIDTEDGEVRVSDGKTGDLTVTTEDGDVRLRNSIFTNLNIESEDGNLDLHNRFSDVHTYKIRNEDGDLLLRMYGNGGTLEITRESGNVTASPEFNLKSKSSDKVVYTIGDGFAKAFITCFNGDVEITKANHKVD